MSALRRPASTAAELLRLAWVARVSIWIEDGQLRFRSNVDLAPAFIEALRAAKLELLDILTGGRCRFCGGSIEDRKPGWLPFADGSAVHVGCLDEAEEDRLAAVASRALSAEAQADPAETLWSGRRRVADADVGRQPRELGERR